MSSIDHLTVSCVSLASAIWHLLCIQLFISHGHAPPRLSCFTHPSPPTVPHVSFQYRHQHKAVFPLHHNIAVKRTIAHSPHIGMAKRSWSAQHRSLYSFPYFQIIEDRWLLNISLGAMYWNMTPCYRFSLNEDLVIYYGMLLIVVTYLLVGQ